MDINVNSKGRFCEQHTPPVLQREAEVWTAGRAMLMSNATGASYSDVAVMATCPHRCIKGQPFFMQGHTWVAT